MTTLLHSHTSFFVELLVLSEKTRVFFNKNSELRALSTGSASLEVREALTGLNSAQIVGMVPIVKCSESFIFSFEIIDLWR